MRLRSFRNRCVIANAAGDLFAVGVATGAIVGLLAGSAAALVAIMLTGSIVAALLGLVPVVTHRPRI